MEFIVKDLMISVLPLNGINSDLVFKCGGDTVGGCGMVGTHIWNPNDDYAVLPVSPYGLSILKRQLQIRLAMVEAKEKATYELMKPTSAVEIEVLQSHLKAALEELKETAGKLESSKNDESYEQV